MKSLADCSVDAVITDPPYLLHFMGKDWDKSEGDLPTHEVAFRAWLAGLICGEGYFRIHRVKDGSYYSVEFGIHMRADEAPLLRALHRRTGIGSITEVPAQDKTVKSAPSLIWKAQSRSDCRKVAALLEGQPLYGKKQREFDLWCKALRLWETTPKGSRWNGPRDNSAMELLYEEMKSLRPFDLDLAESSFNPFGQPDYLFHYQWAKECLRVLKPGGHLLAFGGSRTYHRLACAIEDAGFEIRDQIQYIYGSGFPKSLNVSKNLRAEESVCICNDQGSLYRPETKRAANAPLYEHGMRCVPDANLSETVRTRTESWEVLQSPLSEPNTSQRGPAWSQSEASGREESGLEGRSNLLSETRQLCANQVRSVSAGISGDGPQGWLRDGASVSDGSMDRASTHENGSSASRRSQPTEQPAHESSVMAEQSEPQTSGAWPLCGRCGKPMVPEGLGSALKPAHEPIVVARKPLTGTLSQNVLSWGTGAVNVDGCRIDTRPERLLNRNAPIGYGSSSSQGLVVDGGLGRWPANVIHDGSDEVLASFPDAPGQQGDLNGHSKDRLSKGIFGDMKAARDAVARLDSGSAARFFKSCSYSEIEALFHRAKAIMYAWNPSLASTADNLSSLSSEQSVSVLRRAVIAGSQGAKLLSDSTGLSTTATPLELKRLGETLITAILSIERNVSLAQPQEEPIDNGCLVRIAATQRQTDTTTITISHWKSNGSADPVTLTLTSLNSEVGAKDSSASRLIYCAKPTQEDRNEGCEDLPLRVSDETHKRPRTELDDPRRAGVTPRRNNHPTVKPTDLMRYLCRLVTPPNGIVLDPFMGSGSTGKAAMLEGLRFVGIELSAEYCELAQRRIEAATKQGRFLFEATA